MSSSPGASFWLLLLLLLVLLLLGFEADVDFRRLKESDRNSFLPAGLVIVDEEASEDTIVPATPPREFLR